MQKQQQEQYPNQPQSWRQHLKRVPWKRLIVFIFASFLIAVGATFWILNGLSIIHGPWVTILTAIFVACGILVGLLQWLFPVSSHRPQPFSDHPPSYIPQIIVQVPTLQSLPPQSPPPTRSAASNSRGIQNSSSSTPTIISQDEPTIEEKDETELSCPSQHQEDWEGAPHVENFYGRDKEFEELAQWIVNVHCRLVAVLGMGGVGKTALSKKLVERIKDEFEYVFWRSLQHAPSLESILKKCIKFFSDQQQIDLSDDIGDQIELLIHYLRNHRCLVILDNVESVLQGGTHVGQYRDGYEGYGRLFQCVGEVQHQSCLLLTSREKPKEIAYFEGTPSRVHSLLLSGLGEVEGQAILKDKGLLGSDKAIADLVNLYLGNPLALKLVSEPILKLFEGDIGKFLKEKEAFFGDIHDLLNQQFERLSPLELEIMYWLAIEREPVSLEDLREDTAYRTSKRLLLEALNSLQRRSMIETTSPGCFTLQPVIMAYVTDGFVEQIFEEIKAETVKLFVSHAIIKAQAKDYVRNSQIRVILTPLGERLLTFVGRENIMKKITNILTKLRETSPPVAGYAAGNVLNLLIYLQADLSGADFSRLVVWQAYLQNIALHDVNFAYAHFAKSVFTETFGSILSVAFSHNRDLLAVVTDTGEIRLWEATTATPLLTFHGHTDYVRSITFSPDGRLLASGSDDQTVRLWEVSTGRCLKVLQEHTHRVRSVAFSPDGRLLASGSDDQTVRLWEVNTGNYLKALKGHTDWLGSVTFSPDGSILASVSFDHTVRLWEVNTDCCFNILLGHINWVYSVSFNHDGSLLATGSEDQTVRLWEVSTGNCLKILQGHTNPVWSVTFSPNGSLLASGTEDKKVRLWEVSTARCLHTLQGHTNWIYSVAFSPDGKVLASSSGEQIIRLWEVSTARCLHTLQGHTNWIYSVAFSPDGNLLASGSDDQTIRLWDVRTGQCLKTLQGHGSEVKSIIFSPNGNMLASGSSDQTIRLWEVSTGHCLTILQGHTNWVNSVAFNPAGTVLVSGSEDQTIRLWEVNTGHCLKILQGHDSWISSVAFSPDGTIIASGSGDQTIWLWEVSTGHCLTILRGHSNPVRSVSFRPNGRVLASGSHDGTLKFWDVETGDCITTFRSERPYEGMNITGVKGLTEAQKAILKALGAIEGGC